MIFYSRNDTNSHGGDAVYYYKWEYDIDQEQFSMYGTLTTFWIDDISGHIGTQIYEYPHPIEFTWPMITEKAYLIAMGVDV